MRGWFWPHGRARRGLHLLAVVVVAYLLVAYVALPYLWIEHERRHPALDAAPKVTVNADGIPGDALNVALVGSREELIKAMLATGWKPADPVTLRSSLEIAESVVFDRPDLDAPVSPLFLYGRPQDLAFEQEVGASASERHHVRWWRAEPPDEDGRPLWMGDADFDRDAGISHLTGQITHHIGPDIDADRDRLINALAEAGWLERRYEWLGVGPTQDGRNAGGDRYFTDGMIWVGVLKPGGPGS